MRKGINVFITVMDFKAPKAGIVVEITSTKSLYQYRRFFRNMLLTYRLTNQLVINLSVLCDCSHGSFGNLYLPYIYMFGYITFALIGLVDVLRHFFLLNVVSNRKLPLLTTKAAGNTRVHLGFEVNETLKFSQTH